MSPSWARQDSFVVDSALRPPDRLVLSLYVKPMEWARPTEDALTPDQETNQALINYWRPFNQRNPSIAHMRDLYPHSFRLPMVARGEEYFIPFPANLDKRSYQHVVEDKMYMSNHDFDETVELAWPNL